jgi:hypothetical protein
MVIDLYNKRTYVEFWICSRRYENEMMDGGKGFEDRRTDIIV